MEEMDEMEKMEEMKEIVEMPESITSTEEYPAETAPVQAKKRKRKFGDNWLVLGIKADLLMTLGELISGFLLGIALIVPQIMGNPDVDLIALIDDISMGTYSRYDWINTAITYFEFLGIWVVMLLWFLIRRKNRPLFKAIGTKTAGNNGKKLLLGFGIGFAMNGFCILLAYLHGDFVLHFARFEILPLLAILICVFIQSSAEELVCRVYYYQRLVKSYGNPRLAILISSAFFAGLHIFNDGVGVLPLIDIFASGILFAMIVYYLDSFWCACAVHCAWNFTQNIIFGLPNSGIMVPYSIMSLDTSSARNSIFYNSAFGIEGSVMSILVQVIACLLIWLWAGKHPAKPTDIWKNEE